MYVCECVCDSLLPVVQDMLAIPTVKGEKSPSERFAGALTTYTIEALMQNGSFARNTHTDRHIHIHILTYIVSYIEYIHTYAHTKYCTYYILIHLPVGNLVSMNECVL